MSSIRGDQRETVHILVAVCMVAAVMVALVPTVAVAQTRPALVRDVDRAASQPFEQGTGGTTFAASNSSLNATLMTVPAGKRAVVEHVSCINYLTSPNNFVRLELQYTSGGAAGRHQFVHTDVGESFISGVEVWSFSQPVRLYADANTPISILALRRSTAGIGGIECYVSGHYVDVP